MKRVPIVLCGLLVASLIIAPTQADILSVSGPVSSAGTTPLKIAPPSDVLDNCVTNTGQQGFDERQQVTTTAAHGVDGGGIIPAGTTFVNSHLIFLNRAGVGSLSHYPVTWEFDFPIIGVMSNGSGTLEAASTGDFGAPGTNYTVVPIAPTTTPCGTNNLSVPPERAAPFANRGLETPFTTGCTAANTNDGYTVSGESIDVCMFVSQPGAWIRVLT